jgi:hypothetical protein
MKIHRLSKKNPVLKKRVVKHRPFIKKQIQSLVDTDESFNDVSHVDTGQAEV